MRIYEKARELGIESKELIELLEKLGFGQKTASSSIDSIMEEKIAESFSGKKSKATKSKDEKTEVKLETLQEKRRRERREAILKSIGSAHPKPVTPRRIVKVEPEKPPTKVPKTSVVELRPRPKKPKKLKPLHILEKMKVSEYAEAAGVTTRDVLCACMTFGVMATANQKLSLDVIEAVSEELGFFPILVDEKEFHKKPAELREAKKHGAKQEVQISEAKDGEVSEVEGEVKAEDVSKEEEAVPTAKEQSAKKAKKRKKKKAVRVGGVSRSPVVTVMGHVDHGKTTLLDHIRSANVVAGEKGGITQHIGAYSVETKQGRIAFIDTPGHAAFTEMRARGADVTDIVILVVSQDDKLMPQTKEAIDHARAAEVPIIIAINKMDLPGASADRIKSELASYGLMVEELGGDTLSTEISALKGEGVPHLLELVALQAEMMELKADPEGSARGVIIEALLDKFRGSTATLLIKEGTLKKGDSFVSGCCSGRIRSMENERGKALKMAGPSTPVVITGMSSVPQAGEEFIVVSSDSEAHHIAEDNRIKSTTTEESAFKSMTLEDFFSLVQGEGIKELPVVLKADVDGSLEAISMLVGNLGDSEVKVKIIHSGVGAITKNDVLLAEASSAVVVGFNIKADNLAKTFAKKKSVDIKLYDIIYELSADIKAALEGMLEPEIVEEKAGTAEIRQVFKIPRVGLVAGSYIQEGVFRRGFKIEVVRAGEVIGNSKVTGLKRFKDDVKEVNAGFECGIELSGFKDFVEGDILVAYEVKKVLRRLE
ncbi:translation initiation factor IF-2 [bacterium]|nr:translation initiation factor IF-2 [bacterium]